MHVAPFLNKPVIKNLPGVYQAGNAKSLNSTVSLTSVIAQSSQEVSISEVHLFNY